MWLQVNDFISRVSVETVRPNSSKSEDRLNRRLTLHCFKSRDTRSDVGNPISDFLKRHLINQVDFIQDNQISTYNLSLSQPVLLVGQFQNEFGVDHGDDRIEQRTLTDLLFEKTPNDAHRVRDSARFNDDVVRRLR